MRDNYGGDYFLNRIEYGGVKIGHKSGVNESIIWSLLEPSLQATEETADSEAFWITEPRFMRHYLQQENSIF